MGQESVIGVCFIIGCSASPPVGVPPHDHLSVLCSHTTVERTRSLSLKDVV